MMVNLVAPTRRSNRWRVPPSALVVAVALTVSFAGSARAAAPDAYADVLHGLRGEVSAETAGEVSSYRIEATLDVQNGRIA